MEKKKLIVKKKDENDGRLVRILLTPLGKKKQDIAKHTVKMFNQQIAQGIPDAKLEVFREVIGRIHEIINSGEIMKILNAE
jgi:DNA-binding MarR family transcriptional regulator